MGTRRSIEAVPDVAGVKVIAAAGDLEAALRPDQRPRRRRA